MNTKRAAGHCTRAVERKRPLRAASPFHLAAPADLLDGQPNLIGLLGVLLVTGLLLGSAAVTLQRRDIRV